MFTRISFRFSLLTIFCSLAISGFLPGCSPALKPPVKQAAGLMDHLLLYKGKQLTGAVIYPAGKEAPFQGEQISLEILATGGKQVRLPIYRNQQVYRTLILRQEEQVFSLQHENKKPNGQQAEISMYGGQSEGPPSPHILVFPADAYSRQLLGDLRENVWSLALNNDRSVLSYIMEENGHVTMQIDFDLSQMQHKSRSSQETFLDMPKNALGKHPALAALRQQ